MSADKVTRIFGWPARQRISGKRQTVLQKIEQGQHVLRAYSNSAVPRMYQKWTTLSRVEVLSNRLKDFGLNKGLENLDAVRQKLAAVSGRFAAFEAESFRTPMDFPLFQRLALPIPTRTQPSPRHQDSRHPRAAADGSSARRRHADHGLAQPPDAGSGLGGLRPHRANLHAGAAALGPAQAESSRAARTSRPRLLLSPDSPGHPGSAAVYAVSQTRPRPFGPQPVRDGARKNVASSQQDPNRLPPSRHFRAASG